MKPLILVFLSSIILITGCTSKIRRYISLTTQFDEPSITLKNGVVFFADYAKGGLDSSACIKLKSANRLFIPEIQVAEVSTGSGYKYFSDNYSGKYLMIEVSLEYPPVKVEISSIIDETSIYFTVLWKDKKITLLKPYVKWNIRSDERIIFVIPFNVYDNQFKSY